MEKQKVVVGMSGGVDSSTVAAMLIEQGYDVCGVTMKIWDGSTSVASNKKHSCFSPFEETEIKKTEKICEQLKINLKIIDLSKEYREEVLDYFKAEYLNGRTPNPCVRCNLKIKFGALLDKTFKSGIDFDYFATGHYARINKTESGKYQLKRGVDLKKDQTYFLYSLSSEQLSKIMFPLGNLNKKEVILMSKKYGLALENRLESQNFIAGGYQSLFKGYINSGNIIDLNGNYLGKHNGIFKYTIGQRRGMGISSSEPYYVVKIDSKNNQIIVGRKEDLYNKSMNVINTVWNTDIDISKPFEALVKIRYAHKGAQAIITQKNNDFSVVFEKPQMSITSGQSAVFYLNDCIIGGGIIE
jgi:tRNA-specific 2-thiouridylase